VTSWLGTGKSLTYFYSVTIPDGATNYPMQGGGQERCWYGIVIVYSEKDKASTPYNSTKTTFSHIPCRFSLVE
jgi:hypothetical protein